MELDGVVVAAADKASPASSAAECCARCVAKRGCNVYVFCGEGWCSGQCWLKRAAGDPSRAVVRAEGPTVPWTSGTLDKDWLDGSVPLPAPDGSISVIALRTTLGDIRLRLKPEWSQPSVDYVRRLARGLPKQEDTCVQCELYRTEPGFLLQGVMRSVIPANTVTQQGPKLMEKGEVGWAGGGPGPDFFIYLGAHPAKHFGTDHTVFAELADEETLALVERIVGLPSGQPGGPNTMRFLDERVQFEVKPQQ